MPSSVEALLFDLDGTICTYRRSGETILSLAFEKAGVDPFFHTEEYFAIFDEFVEGSSTGVENRRRCFAVLAEEAGYDPSIGYEVADAYAEERDQTNVEWLPGAKEAIEKLSKSYSLGLVTNGPPEWQTQKLQALGIADRFEVIVFAGYDTAPKPNPTPFHTALDSLQTAPNQAVSIGDSLGADVLGAQNANLWSIWVDRDGITDPEPSPHYRIELLTELLSEPWYSSKQPN